MCARKTRTQPKTQPGTENGYDNQNAVYSNSGRVRSSACPPQDNQYSGRARSRSHASERGESPKDEGSGGGSSEESPHHSPGQGPPGRRRRSFGRGRSRNNPHRAPRPRQRQLSPRSVEHHRLVSPSSAARQRQGSYRGWDARDGSVDVAAKAERPRRALEVAQATTLRRKGCLSQLQCEIATAESAEREAAAVAATAQHALDHDIGTSAAEATTAPSPLTRQQGVASRSRRPGDDAFLKGSVTCMAS